MNQLGYIFKEAVRGFFQAKLMTFAAICTISLTLFVIGLIAAGFLNIRHWLRGVSEEIDMVVYVTDRTAADGDALELLIEKVRALPGVTDVAYIDKQTAWNRFEEFYGGRMLEAVDENPLPASLELSLDEASYAGQGLESLEQTLSELEGVENVHYSREWFAFLMRIRRWFYIGSAGTVIILVAALLFLISNTIRLTIYGRRELIVNMRYVGATDRFIKMPFLLEGMLQGGIGAAAAVAALGALRVFLGHLPLVWGPWYLVFSVFPIGVIFGWIGSRSAVARFLA